MNIIKYRSSDFVPTTFASLVDRFFENSLNHGVSESSFTPRADVYEFEKHFEIHLVVPGMNKEDFKIDLQDNYLMVTGERKMRAEAKNAQVVAQESVIGTFSRSFHLPETVKAAEIAATYNAGILEIRLPKDEKKVLKQTIQVK
jgi:HSP20 family protein